MGPKRRVTHLKQVVVAGQLDMFGADDLLGQIPTRRCPNASVFETRPRSPMARSVHEEALVSVGEVPQNLQVCAGIERIGWPPSG